MSLIIESSLRQSLTLSSRKKRLNQNPEDYNERNLMNPNLNRAAVAGNLECMNNLQIYVQQIKKTYLNYRNNFEGEYTTTCTMYIPLFIHVFN